MSEPPSAQAIPEEAPLRQGSVSMRRLAPMLLTALFLLAIFVLPYRVPLLNPIASTSWEFGFSNFAARVLVALLLLSLLACQLFLDRRGSESSALDRALLDPAQPGSRWALLIAMGVSQALVCALLIGWYRFLPFARTGEMAYFIQRLAVMVLGRLPYRDFGFAYGPSMLWVPIFIYRVTHARLSIDDAYLITLLFHYVLGFSLIAYAVSHLNQESARARVVIYALMAIPFFNLTMGLNYAPLRFAIAPASILAIRHLYRVYRAQTSPALGGCALALAAFVLPVVNCAISPEMGLAVIASLCVYFLWFLLGPERRSALLVLPVAAGTWAVAAWFPSGYFDSILFFSKGGLDFPLLFTF